MDIHSNVLLRFDQYCVCVSEKVIKREKEREMKIETERQNRDRATERQRKIERDTYLRQSERE